MSMCNCNQGRLPCECRKEGTCTECMQVGELNERGVCDFCEDPYGKSALAQLLELEEAILLEQE